MYRILDAVKEELCRTVVENMDFSREMSDEEVYRLIDDVLMAFPQKEGLSFPEIVRLRAEVFNSLRKLDVIQDYLEDDSITEIMINGPNDIFIERNGLVSKSNARFSNTRKLEDIIQQIVAGCNRTINEASPIVDARLSSGERVNIVLAPVALNGPIVTIRRFPKEPISMDRMIDLKSISEEGAEFLRWLVQAGYNIFISGGTGSGKTTFLNALSQYIPNNERVITIEDSAELQLLQVENLVRLEARLAGSEVSNPITIRDLIRTALRMRPERIIVGECRGAEALDMLQAMNTGHDGSLSTGHANSSGDMVARLETMVLMGCEMPLYAIRSQIAGGIDIFIHLSRMRNGERKVVSVCETEAFTDGNIRLNTIFKYEGGELKKVGTLQHRDKLAGYFSEEELERMYDKL